MAERTERTLRDVEFTYEWYADFLDRIRRTGYTFRGFSTEPGTSEVRLRHDVDLSLEAARRMARFEADRDVSATYFVHLTSKLYNPLAGEHRDRLDEIRALGHDIGLHFSTHEYWDREPPSDAIVARVSEELDVLATVVDDPPAVSFHRPPPWILGRPFESFRSTYAPTFFEEMTYVADSSQRWRDEPPAIDRTSRPLQVLTHPGLWADDDADFEGRIEQAVIDACLRTQQTARSEFLRGVTSS